MYGNELKALHKSGRFRQRKLFDEKLIDLASNDYLGLAGNKKQFNKAVKLVKNYKNFAPKASMLVNGYHPIHAKFEEKMAELNGFEKGLIVGSVSLPTCRSLRHWCARVIGFLWMRSIMPVV